MERVERQTQKVGVSVRQMPSLRSADCKKSQSGFPEMNI